MPSNETVFRLLLAIVCLAPLPLGGHRPWAWSALAIAVGLLLCIWSLGVHAGTARAPVSPGRFAAPAVLFTAVVIWAVVQTQAGVPVEFHHPLWAEAAEALQRPVAAGISIDQELTRTAILRVLTYAGVFLLALQLGRERSRAHLGVRTVAVAGALYAGYGMVIHYSGLDLVLWMEKWAYPGDLTGTFVNRNAYGAYAGLGVLCGVALFFHGIRPSRGHRSRGAQDVAESLLYSALPALLAAVIIGWALLLSHSRGAFLGTGAGLLALLACAMTARAVTPRTGLIAGIAVAVIAVAVIGVGGDQTLQRLLDTSTVDARTDLFRLTQDAISDSPLVGHGFGAFEPAFRLYRDNGLASPLAWEFAHSVHLELVMDLGLPGAVVFYGALALLLAACLRGLFRRRRDQIYPALAVGAAVLVGTHGFVDFSAQIPAVAMTLALLLGIGVAQSWSTDRRAE